MKELLESQVVPAITQRSECLADWYKMAQTVFLQTQILDKDMDIYERTLETFTLRLLQESKERYDGILRSLDSRSLNPISIGKPKSNESSSVPDDNRRKRLQDEELGRKWSHVCSLQEQINCILHDNIKLVDEVNMLSSMEYSLTEKDL